MFLGRSFPRMFNLYIFSIFCAFRSFKGRMHRRLWLIRQDIISSSLAERIHDSWYELALLRNGSCIVFLAKNFIVCLPSIEAFELILQVYGLVRHDCICLGLIDNLWKIFTSLAPLRCLKTGSLLLPARQKSVKQWLIVSIHRVQVVYLKHVN